jgi:hypothetical protein
MFETNLNNDRSSQHDRVSESFENNLFATQNLPHLLMPGDSVNVQNVPEAQFHPEPATFMSLTIELADSSVSDPMDKMLVTPLKEGSAENGHLNIHNNTLTMVRDSNQHTMLTVGNGDTNVFIGYEIRKESGKDVLHVHSSMNKQDFSSASEKKRNHLKQLFAPFFPKGKTT